MEVYKKYVVRHCIWTVSIALIGVILMMGIEKTEHLYGWLWGVMTHLVYFLFLVLQTRKIQFVPSHELKTKVRIAVMSRFSLIVLLVIGATQVPGVSMLGLLVGVAIFTPIQYIDHFMYSRHS